MSRGRAGLVREALFNGNGVAKRLIVSLVLFSGVVMTVITALELWLGYRNDLARIAASIDFIERSYRPTLTDSVWIGDREQVQSQIEGLLHLPDIEYVGIVVDGRPRWTAGAAASQRRVEAQIPLVRAHRGEKLTIGVVQVAASVDRVLARLWEHLLVTLLGNGVKTLLVAGFMLLVFQYLVTRHLAHAASFMRGIDPAAPGGEQLRLDRPPTGRWRPDILDALTASLNTLSASLHGAAQDLRRSDQRLRALTRHSMAYLCEIDGDGRIVFASRAEGGLAHAGVEGSLLVDGFPAASRPALAQAIARTFADGTPQLLEYTAPDAAGRPRSYVAGIARITHEGAGPTAAFTAVDISAQKAAEREVRELATSLEARVRERTAQLEQTARRAENANRAKSEFLSRMSHELRTPMNAILGFAQIIEMSAPSPRQLKWAGEIRRAGDHLLQMIEDLLDLARIEVGKLAVRLEAVDVSTVVSEAVAIVQPLVAARRIVLDVEPGTGIDTQVDADRLRLRQVLVNLLSNAAKYNREAGTITLRCRPHDGKLRLSVADTGNGIAPERLHGLFQPFERLGAETGPVEGTGIGLALCKQLAEMMGAEIGVDSRVGVGSTFWIDLRRAGARPAAPGTGAGAIEGRGPPACELLVIEDNAANAEVLAAFLAPYPDVHVRIAPHGEAGLALAAQSAPDIVLVDIRLPGIDGYEVLRRLRADPRLADTGIAAVSADAMPGDVGRGLAAGFDAYLAKPVDRRELLGLIKRLLASRLRPAP